MFDRSAAPSVWHWGVTGVLGGGKPSSGPGAAPGGALTPGCRAPQDFPVTGSTRCTEVRDLHRPLDRWLGWATWMEAAMPTPVALLLLAVCTSSPRSWSRRYYWDCCAP